MDLAKLKVVELRSMLSERGLDAKGNKPVLLERLRKALEDDEEVQEYGEDRSTLQTENISDTALKETQIMEAARSSQPPRTPSRASRSSSMVTPTKVSTRNTSRAMTPNSSKQTTPSKLEDIEKTQEMLTTMSESISDESAVQEEKMSKLYSEKYKEEQEDVLNVQNEDNSSSSEKLQEEEAKYTNILENKYKANVPQVPATESFEKSSILAHVDQFSINRGEYGMKEFSIDEDSKIQEIAEKTENIAKLEEKEEIKEDTDIDEIQDDVFEENIEQKISFEKESTKHIEDTYNIKDNIDIPTVEQSTHVITDQIDETCDIELKNEEKGTDEDCTVQEKMDVSANVEGANDKADNDILQIAEVADTKKEDTKFDSKQSNKKERNDKKRKRSSSPANVYEKPPKPQKMENEPNFDKNAMILSWYDSDLNLVINKEDFLSATPMHDGDFCHIWAGARASYGFMNGKIYYEVKITEQHPVGIKDEKHSHVLRIGWSVSSTSMQLGQEKLSYAYTSAGQKGTDSKFIDYGTEFNKDDVVGCYLDMTPENTVELFYTVNGKDLGSAFSILKEELGDQPLFPHILSKNYTFACNFGQEEAWCEQIPEYVFVGNVDLEDRVAGPRRPEGKSDCEVIMVCGLPAAGKTFWAKKHAAEHPDKFYNILGLHDLVEKTKDVALSDQEQNAYRQEIIIDKCNRALDQLIDIAGGRRRNYILDQKSNVYSSVQRRKMRNFCGYQRKAIIVIPTSEEYSQRLAARGTEGDTSESSLMEIKANFAVPSVGESFDLVEWIGLEEMEGKKFIEKYNKEGKDAGFGQHVVTKRPRLDKTEGNRETRDSRNNRDTRDNRRNNYQDRGRNTPWRGANMGGWRGERPQRGGYMRHTGYGPPAPWRLRGRGGPAVRGSDRRVGNVDRRNDRNRSVAPRQGGWGSMSSNYQSQQSGWGQQDNWSSSQSQGSWNQSNWGQQQQQWGGGWKGYGQSTYSQAGYNQQGYGNGNWNSWNQQYYNNQQYWGQQQQSGQIAAAGSQAESTSETVATTPSDMETGYSYSQG